MKAASVKLVRCGIYANVRRAPSVHPEIFRGLLAAVVDNVKVTLAPSRR